MSFEEAAGLSITYPTSYAALVIRAKLQKGILYERNISILRN